MMGLPCSNSPNDAQCTHAIGALTDLNAACNAENNSLRPFTNALAFALKRAAMRTRPAMRYIPIEYKDELMVKGKYSPKISRG